MKSSGKLLGTVAVYRPTMKDRERVKNLLLLGTPEPLIAICVGPSGINVETLHKYFGEELTRYRELTLSTIARSAYKMALMPEDGGYSHKLVSPEIRSRMIQFVLKTRAGWRESDTTIINAQNVQVVKRVIGVDEKDL